MNELIANLKSQWAALPPHMRQFAIAGTVIIVLALLYTVLWSPLQKDLVRLRANVPRTTEQLNWMRMQAPIAKAMRAKASASSGPLLPAIEQSATTYGVRTFVTKMETEGNSGARVTLEAVPFNALVTWLSEMQATQGAVVEDATIDAHATPGVVNARLRLRTGGA